VTIRVLRFEDYKSVPWKNKKGTTSEILILPEDGKFPEGLFDWRLSSATIREAGDFSLFPGFDRALVLIEGRELILRDRNSSTKLMKNDVHYFHGEDQIRSEIPHGPVKDLNLIYRRGLNLNLSVVDLTSQNQKISVGKLSLLFVMDGSILFPDDHQTIARTGDTIFIAGATKPLNADPHGTDRAKACLMDLS
jgi:environmental stress-induced protein Ves